MPVSIQISALAISAIYYLWRDGYVAERREKDCRLRQRVAYMLWAAALHDLRPVEGSPTASNTA
jgi:hypothetical protein